MVNCETKGKYLAPESLEEIRREKQERAEERAEAKRKAAFDRGVSWLMLIGGVSGLIYMILGGLIDQKIGVWLLAVVAAVCGRGTK